MGKMNEKSVKETNVEEKNVEVMLNAMVMVDFRRIFILLPIVGSGRVVAMTLRWKYVGTASRTFPG
jgi:hypothetical protein